ncbi:agglutinin biogenesis protein MshI [Rhodocyclus tenuis]|uniref:Agglutinin biogenesis protein MshI n=1 Tax=Rhodocyclus gracilis TaxID=2929842 RepID=A0ABX0WH81_9RHOO|nr:agglutinin biogenesis protein MshI [Rhodocyclus gracilis]NJA88216.1 agglutinin biogenesis protein MshI [Rhodocyclus gracilis]
MLPLSRVRRQPGWLAVVVQGGRVVLAHGVRHSGARPEIRLLESFRVEEDEKRALERLRASHGLKAYACTTLLPLGHYTLTQVDAPNVPVAERREAARWGLKGLVDFPVDTACVDVLDIPLEGGGRQASIFVAAAAESAVRACALPFEDANVTLASIDIPELAQRNIAALFEDENRGLAFLHLDENGGRLTLTYRGELIAVRRVEIAALQLADDDVARRDKARERLALELQRSLDNFDRQFSFISVSKLLLAVSPPVEELRGFLAENLYVPVVDMDLATVMDFPSVPELRERSLQAASLLAIGAALRSDEVAA